ncbi:hypothetical protein AJ79_08390 [Helicocarpus griseus UAMH5409]|uniref:DUF6314 domain-containing protein n=1 Tax=Helicocarpus griseus UAMH5409 TaxID=1447875 RepID=A0A2B7WTB8_9EURO|nr:hypothetical protein AJ79_08390 [Helicocarpus griseus UAMH5409]
MSSELETSSESPASVIFRSLSDPRPWHLTRTLQSENPADLNGELKGTASFVSSTDTDTERVRELLYKEEGEMPGAGGGLAGLRWSRKYIWRLSTSSYLKDEPKERATKQENEESLSVWFVKLHKPTSDSERTKHAAQTENIAEADYIFHELEFQDGSTTADGMLSSEVPRPFAPNVIVPPSVQEPNTKIVVGRGRHLCINDDYLTIYAFRLGGDPENVVSWSSRHIVRGPKKSQDIVNLYSRKDVE